MSNHRIEHSVQVYLLYRDGEWVVDPVTLDGYDLDPVLLGPTLEDGARNGECAGAGCPDQHECHREREHADATPLPTGYELSQLLLRATHEGRPGNP